MYSSTPPPRRLKSAYRLFALARRFAAASAERAMSSRFAYCLSFSALIAAYRAQTLWHVVPAAVSTHLSGQSLQQFIVSPVVFVHVAVNLRSVNICQPRWVFPLHVSPITPVTKFGTKPPAFIVFFSVFYLNNGAALYANKRIFRQTFPPCAPSVCNVVV